MDSEIELVESFGHLIAYKVNDPEHLLEYVPDFPLEYYKLIKKMSLMQPIIYISDLFIVPEFRKRGLAVELLDQFLSSYDGDVFLIAGSLETPKTFDIVSFYESFGFEVVSDDFDFPLMLKSDF